MSYRGLIVLGCGGHARSVADIALDAGVESLLFVDASAGDDESIAGFPVARAWPQSIGEGWAAMPASGAAQSRRAAVDAIRERGVTLATLISRRAYVGRSAIVGPGTLVAHGAHVGPFARIGEGVILNTSSLVDHESVVGDYTHVAVHATIAGRCRVGSDAMIGAGAVLIDNVAIGDGVTIGAGGVVVADLSARGVYVGVPVRALSSAGRS
jgi:UDP-N-acetylbacillosamine N-acetyltransferase